MYFLDTNTCMYYLAGRSESIKARLLKTPPQRIGIPSIVKAELILGACMSDKKATNLEKVELFLSPFDIVPFTDGMTYAYAEIRRDLERKGTPIGPNDLIIASIVKASDGTIVTNNEAEFRRVKGLKVENWS